MKQSEKIISGLQQDIVLPDIVLQKADDAFSRILAEKENSLLPARAEEKTAAIKKENASRSGQGD